MKDIIHNKFSLFQLEKKQQVGELRMGGYNPTKIVKTTELIDTFDSLEEAKAAQEKLKVKTIIIPTY